MKQDEKQRFETIELPALIKNLKVPSLDVVNADGQRVGFYFKREGINIILYKRAIDILQNNHIENDIFAYLFDEAKVQKIFLSDDKEIMFYIRDSGKEENERKFLWIHYHKYTENLNQELKLLFKNFPNIGACYGVAESDNYYFASINSLSENKELIDKASPIVHKYLPEGFTWKFLNFKEGTSIAQELIKNDYEKLN